MVLFTEREALLLLDMYLRLRSRAENVATNGVLLKAAARATLTRAINLSTGDGQPRSWTEGQIFVKFKNLRVDYALVKWLQEQPGFTTSDEGMSKEWWAAIKTQRPKAHVFKGKLPWPYFSRMAMILQDAPYVPQEDAATAQRITELLAAADSDEGRLTAATAAATRLASAKAETSIVHAPAETTTTAPVPVSVSIDVGRENTAAAAVPEESAATPARRVSPVARHETPKRARAEEETPAVSPYTPVAKRSRSSFGGASEDTSPVRSPHHDSLSRSIEQCSAAAAGMARGFQELVSVFQTQAEKCRDLELAVAAGTVAVGADDAEASADATCVRTERQVLLSIARSLEKSTQASADMARGYHDLVQHFVRESDVRRLL